MNYRCINSAVQTLQENPHFDAETLEFETFATNEEFTTTEHIADFMFGVRSPFTAMAEVHDRAIEIIKEYGLDDNQSTIDEFNLVWYDVGRWVCENEWPTILARVEEPTTDEEDNTEEE